MPNLTERLSQYPDMAAKRGGDGGDTGSMMGGMSIRNGSQQNINPNTLGIKDLPEIFDDRKHKMKFKYKAAGQVIDALYCNLCNDEIDVVLGYFNCNIC